MAKEFPENLMFYKAKKDGKGAASQWSLSSERNSVFLEMTNQVDFDDNKNAKFDWDNKIRFKLGVCDIGEIISVLVNMQQGVGPLDVTKNRHKGLYHSNEKGNAILYFGKDKKNEIFRIQLSVKRDGKQTVVKHAISKGEVCILNTLLCRAIEVMYRWC